MGMAADLARAPRHAPIRKMMLTIGLVGLCALVGSSMGMAADLARAPRHNRHQMIGIQEDRRTLATRA